MSVLHPISGCEQAERKADVEFVHGLGDDAFETWRHGEDDRTSWPHWLGQAVLRCFSSTHRPVIVYPSQLHASHET